MVNKKLKLVKVDWNDAALDVAEDDAIEQALKIQPVRRTNIGFLLEKSKHRIVLAFGRDQYNRVSDILVIPKQWGIKIKELKE